MEARAVLGIAPCYHKSRSRNQQTVTKKKNVPVFLEKHCDVQSDLEIYLLIMFRFPPAYKLREDWASIRDSSTLGR
jgi:hypothetical protein